MLHGLTHSFPTRRSSDLCPRDPRTRSRPPCGSSPNGQDRVRAWGAQRLEPRCRASGRRTIVVIVAQLSYIEHGSQEVLMAARSEEHTSELQSLMRISYAVFCLKKTKHNIMQTTIT